MDPVRYIVELFGRWRTSSDPSSWGRRAEDLTALYLRLRGYLILERNWRTRWGEIDLIAEKGDTLVFVEVKARRSLAFGKPEDAITRAKKQKLLTLAKLYLSSYSGRAQKVRFDVITWEKKGCKCYLKHFQGVIEDEGK